MKMYRSFAATLVALLMLVTVAGAEERLKMSTTTSTQDSGLLKVLLPPFEKKNNVKVDVIAVGTGQALKLGEAGDVDVVFVHARKLEDKFVADGFGVNRKDVMYNDFVIIGPKNDPAGIAKAKTAAEALKLLATKGASFISRGDKSGTHTKELDLWKSSGIEPKGNWYVEAGQGMGPVITMATERRAYTLTDRGTYNAFKGAKTDLVILFQGEKGLFNPYGIMAVNPKKFPHVKYDLAMKLIDYVTGPEGLKIIADYKAHGEPVFFIYNK
ncbi:substrate-binding domain-containing protein [Geobacter sulfurreducens]|jgi:tungstate transport system substrate-binding protein|uniref:substrate-binding domain-containing protein n=1 Tax=Geobacter sulfurreducens TaxID=35554 RepID=UPI0001D8F433|nr:substrate-binding domain-containing protein [Geobacter sulfurreducens]ADI85458.1 tungstate ABC transporter, periplasmic tungstate-binding protein [Geobacter sulfurreducens KN400]QVW34528.1 substrate-binding domain-containing protein [Geobacter sulfurreducens]UTG92031.1 substrate-binding domain-containing protein [Geobacter sulfurreducens]